jgi:hypothetical protein
MIVLFSVFSLPTTAIFCHLVVEIMAKGRSLQEQIRRQNEERLKEGKVDFEGEGPESGHLD